MKSTAALPFKPSLLRSALAWKPQNRGILLGVYYNLTLLAASVIALPFDRRQILGLNPWIKPIKFELSIVIFLATIALLLAVLGETGRWRKTRASLGYGFSLCMVIEITVIALQSARGVPSHMNYTSVLNALLFAIMGVFVAINTALLAVLLALFLSTRLPRPKAELWGIRLGLTLALAGSFEGVRIVTLGAHTVGAPDGGPGLPFLNWSTLHGDLRPAHFLALHALQLLWAGGWLLSQTKLPPRAAVAAIFATAILYSAADWFLFAQALAGRPLFALR